MERGRETDRQRQRQRYAGTQITAKNQREC